MSASAPGAVAAPSAAVVDAYLVGSAYGPHEAAFATDCRALVDSVNTYLPLAFLYHDYDRVSFYLRRLLHSWELRRPDVVTAGVKRDWIQLLLAQLLQLGEELPMWLQTKIMSIVLALLRHEKTYDLAIEWQPLYAYLARYHLNVSTRGVSIFTTDSLLQHQHTLVKMIAKLRRYLVSTPAAASGDAGGFASPVPAVASGSVGEEVLQTFIPFLSPFDNKYFASQALLYLFFPTQLRQPRGASTPAGALPAATVASFHKLIKLYTPFTSNLIDQCPLTIRLNVSLYARMAKHSLGVLTGDGDEILAPFVEKNRASFFSTFLQTLELDVGGKASQNMKREWTANYADLVPGHRPGSVRLIAMDFAKYIVYTLHYGAGAKTDEEKKNSTQGMLTSLLYTLRTYVHPSQTSGRSWHEAIGNFIVYLVAQYCKRLGREIRGEAPYDRRFFLDPTNLDFVQTIQPIALQGLYSKSGAMIGHCETALRHLATFFPRLVLPSLMSSIEQSLVDVNTSHRLMSSLQMLTTLAPIAFNAEVAVGSNGGAKDLVNLLVSSLPGVDVIDVAKSSFTMTWLTILFYLLPIADAREGNSSEEDAQLPGVKSLTPALAYAQKASVVSGEAYNEAVETARTATMQFEDWSVSYVDTLLRLLASSDKFAKLDWADRAFARLLYKHCRAFFSALSPKLYGVVANKIVKLVLSEHHPATQKQYGILIHTLSISGAEAFLAAFLPAALKRLVVKDALAPLAPSELQWLLHLIGQGVKQAGGASACPDATAAGLKGHLLLPFVKPIQQVYELTADHDEKGVRKSSRKMLRNLLKGLTTTYPAEWRNFSPIDHWAHVADKNKPTTWKHWKAWGTYAPKTEPRDAMPSIDLIWHVPSAEEMEAAEGLLARALKKPIEWLASWIDGTVKDEASSSPTTAPVTAVGKGDTPLERNLQSLISAVRGVPSVMGTIQGEELFSSHAEDDLDHAYSRSGLDCGSRCPALNVKRTQPVKPLGGAISELVAIGSTEMKALPSITSFRTHLVRLTHAAFSRARTLASGPIHAQPSTKSAVLLLKLANQALTNYGMNEQTSHQDRHSGKYSRQRLRDLLTGHRSRMRPQLVQKTLDFHYVRMLELSYNEVYTADVRALVGDLHRAATNDFTKIRARATALLVATNRRFPGAIDETIEAMLAVFANTEGKASDESLIGCMGVLADSSVANWISRKWRRVSSFVQTFFKYGQQTSKDDRVQMLIQQLFNTLFPHMGMRTVALPLVSTDPAAIPANLRGLIDASKVSRRNEAIKRHNVQLSKTYLELMTFLHSTASGQAVVDASASTTAGKKDEAQLAHWRYSLMSAAFFFSLSRPGHYETALATVGSSSSGLISHQAFVSFFLRACTSTLAPLRLIGFMAVSKTLSTHSLAVRTDLNRLAEAALGTDAARVLASMDTGKTTPEDAAASLTKGGAVLTFTSIDSQQEALGTIFYDNLFSGWMGDSFNTVVCKYFANTSGKHEHMNAWTNFTPLSIHDPLRFPFKPLASVPHMPVPPLAPASLVTIFEFFTTSGFKNLADLLTSFVFNHPSLAPTIEGQANERAGDGAGDQIASLAGRSIANRTMWPVTRFTAKSAAFSAVHMRFIRGLVEAFPQLVTAKPAEGEKGLLLLVADLIAVPDEADKACTAAEVLCGIMLATKHMTHGNQVAFQTAILPLLTTALQTAQPDCLHHFGDALRYMYTNNDPRRMAWLSRALFLDALGELPQENFIDQNQASTLVNPSVLDTSASDGGGLNSSPQPPSPDGTSSASSNAARHLRESPSVQFKRLRYILPILIEVGYRGSKLGEWMLMIFKQQGWLAHPYKQVREEIAWLLFVMMRNEYQLHENHPAQSPGGRISEPADTLSLVSSPVFLQFLQYVREQFTEVVRLYRDDKANPTGSPKPNEDASGSASPSPSPTVDDAAQKRIVAAQKDRAKHFIETILTWLHATMVCGDMVFVSLVYQAFLPFLLWSQHHPDAEIGAIAKYTSGGAAWINAGGPALAEEPQGGSKQATPVQSLRSLHEADALPQVTALSLTVPHAQRAPLDSPAAVRDSILGSLRSTALSSEHTWHVRVAVAKFLQIWLPRHSLALSADQLAVVETLLVDTLLVDTQVEVREAASSAFQSFVTSCFPLVVPSSSDLAQRVQELENMGEEEPTGAFVLKPHPHIAVLTKKLQALVSAGAKRNNTTKSLDVAGLARRHGGLLGLSGLVLTHPYDLPSHLPSLLSYLAVYVEDRNQSISSSLRKAFASFTATHKDEWATTFSKQFTEEQLEELQAMQLAPSYFA